LTSRSGGFQAVHLGLNVNTPLNIFQPQASSSTHVQLDDMSQHPQQTVHYAPLARSATKDDITKQNGMSVIIDDDDDDDGDSDDGAHKTNHNRRKRSFTSLRRSTSGHAGSRSRSRRSGSPAHVYDVDDECTGLIAPNGMEVPLATVDQKRRKWWRDALINLCFIAGWYVDIVCWLCNGSIDIGLVRLRGWAAFGCGCSNESCGGMSRRPSRHSSSRLPAFYCSQ